MTIKDKTIQYFTSKKQQNLSDLMRVSSSAFIDRTSDFTCFGSFTTNNVKSVRCKLKRILTEQSFDLEIFVECRS